MKHLHRNAQPLFILAFLLLALTLFTIPLPGSQMQPVERYFRLEASQFSFSPSILRVNPGDQVTIDLVSTDVVHGLYIDDYGLQRSADPGQISRLTFTASKTGLFRFRCLVPCGQFHPFMTGKLLVGPNTLFLRAVLLTLLGLFTALILLWKTPNRSASS